MFYRKVILCVVAQLLLAATIETIEIQHVFENGQCEEMNGNTISIFDRDVIKFKVSKFGPLKTVQCRVLNSEANTMLTPRLLNGDSVEFLAPENEKTELNCTFENTKWERVSCVYKTHLLSEHNLLFKTNASYNKFIFRSNMTSERNNSYLQCSSTLSHTSVGPAITIIHRVHYIMEQRVHYPVSVRVNRLELVPNAPRNPSALSYEYHCVDGNLLIIICDILNVDGATGRSILILNMCNTTTRKPCGTTGPAKLKLISELTESPYQSQITGLRAENILYQYMDHFGMWTTYYRYRVNETLRLSCVMKVIRTDNFDLLWAYEGKSYTDFFGITKISDVYDVKSIDMNITLDEDNDSKIIKCERRHSTKRNMITTDLVRLILVMAPAKVEQTVSATTTSQIGKASSAMSADRREADSTSMRNKIQSRPDFFDHSPWTIVGTVLACIIICGALCLPIVFWYKKHRRSDEINECHNHCISDEINPSMPLSSEQCRDHSDANNIYTEIEYTAMDNTDSSTQLQDRGENEEYYSEINQHVLKRIKNDADYYVPMNPQDRVPVGTSDTQQVSEYVKNDTQYEVPVNQPGQAPTGTSNNQFYLDMTRHLTKPFKNDADYYVAMNPQDRLPIDTSDTQ